MKRNSHLRMGLLLAGAVTALAAFGTAAAQEPYVTREGFSVESHVPAYSARLTVSLSPPYRALASGPSLHILNDSLPAGSVVSTLTQAGTILDMDYAQGRLYLATGKTGLVIVDVSVPASPSVLSRFPMTDALRVAVNESGEAAYVTGGTSVLRILNVADPSRPKLVGVKDFTNAAFTDSLVSGNTLLVAGGAKGLFVYSIAEPKNPIRVTRVKHFTAVHSLAIRDRLVAALDSELGMVLVDFSAWNAPRILGSLHDAVAATGAAFLEGVPVLLTVAEGVYGTRVVDCTDPEAPLSRAVATSPNPALNVSASGTGSAVLACGEAGLWAMNLGDPDHPALSPLLVGDYPKGALAGLGNRVYVAKNSKIQTWNYAVPSSPSLESEASVSSPAVDLAIAGELLLASCQDAGVLLFSLSNPAAPSLLGSFSFEGSAIQAAVAGSRMAVAAGTKGALLVDISDPSHPVQVGEWTTDTGFIAGVALGSDEILWAAQSDRGTWAVDVTDPQNPEKVGGPVSYDMNQGKLYLRGTHLFQPTLVGSINLADVTDPAKPEGSGIIDSNASFSLAFSGDRMLVCDGASGLREMDVSDPEAAFPVAYFETPGFSYAGAILDNGAVVVSAQEGGLWALSPTNCPGPTLYLPCDGDHISAFNPPIFTWKPTADAKYVIKVSVDPDFPDNHKTYTAFPGGTELKVSGWIPSAAALEWIRKKGREGRTLYWQVVTTVNKVKTKSESRAFTAG
ncbi:MAG: hypothetical protein AB1347_00540 [Acidobacteriota bacterium]